MVLVCGFKTCDANGVNGMVVLPFS